MSDFLTCVRAGDEGKLARVLVRVEALQGANHLASLLRVHTTELQAVQVIAHVPAHQNTQDLRFPVESGGETRGADRPVQGFEAAHVQRESVFRAGAVMEQPAADAGAAVGVLAGSLERAFQHVSAHTAEQTLIHITHKPLQIMAHPTRHQASRTLSLFLPNC